MSIAIIFNNKEASTWAKKIKTSYGVEVEVYPNIKDKSVIDFLLVWRPHDNYLEEFPNVKVVHSIGAGVDHMLNSSVNENVYLARIVDHDLKHDMFEHVLSIVLLENKRLLTYMENQLSHEWKPKRYKSSKNTSITILGVGEIGNYVANKLVDLGYCVKTWSQSNKENTPFTHYFGKEGFLKAILDTDFIVNILPLTKKTVAIFNKNFFNQLNSKPVLINVGRGKHIVEKDLVLALQEEYVLKAFIDVFETEPLPDDHFYWNNNKVFITPHVASVTQADTCIEQIMVNYFRMKNDEPILNTISKEKGY